MKKLPTLTIGVPAFNEGSNIGFLLDDLKMQKTDGFNLEKIIIISDGSTDNTASVVYEHKNNKVFFIDGKENLGKAQRQNQILNTSTSDVLVLLDADISISDTYFLAKLIDPIVTGKGDLTSAGIRELPPRTSFEKVLDVSMRLKRNLFKEFKKGNNVFNCHGPARGFSKELYKQFKFRDSNGEDMYSYLVCKKLNFKFIYVPLTEVFYRLPATPGDHFKQSSRYLDSIAESKGLFGEKFVNDEFNIPSTIYFKAFIKSIPLIIMNIFHVGSYLITYELVRLFVSLGVKTKDSWSVLSSKTIRTL
jgi:glycosyltransferase involved in cell wall biosynthesis